MAVKNIITNGLGVNDGVIGWLTTLGFGSFSSGGATVKGWLFRRRHIWPISS